jgi:hypothetical protein
MSFYSKGENEGKQEGRWRDGRVCPETYEIINIANICKHM